MVMDRKTNHNNNPLEVIDQATNGIPVNLFETLVEESGFNRKTMADIVGINIRTINNYKNKGGAFEKKDAEHLLKLNERNSRLQKKEKK